MINIPHYNLIFKNINSENDIIKIDLLAYKNINNDMWGNEFNINSMKLNNDGIDSHNFFDTLVSILNRKAECNIDFESVLTKINGSCWFLQSAVSSL